MEKIKIQSEEKHFFEYLKKNAPFYGVFGMRPRRERGNRKDDIKFLVLNENLKVIFRHKPYSKGNYMPEVAKKGDFIDKTYPLPSKEQKMRTRTDDSVEDLLCNLLVTASLKWINFFYEQEEPYKRLPDEMFDIEPSSPEFEALQLARNVHHNCIRPNSDSSYDNMDIEYETFGEKGKKSIDDCIEFLKNNKSKTPVQDAWLKVLEN